MLRKTTIAVAAAALMLGAASGAQASKDDSGDYKGGALFGPLPGQIFGLGQGMGPYGYRGGAYRYGGYGAYGYAGPRLRGGGALIDPTEGPNSAGHFRDHWEEY
jgi:uncharacterized membrane protein